MDGSTLDEHLKELEQARQNLARQIESSKAALAELDQKIEALKLNLGQKKMS